MAVQSLTSSIIAALAISTTPSAMATTLLEAVELGLQNSLSLRASDKGVEENLNTILVLVVLSFSLLVKRCRRYHMEWKTRPLSREFPMKPLAITLTAIAFPFSQSILINLLVTFSNTAPQSLDFNIEEIKHEKQKFKAPFQKRISVFVNT